MHPLLRSLSLCFAVAALSACSTRGYGRFYQAMTQTKYPPSKSVRVIQASPLMARQLVSEGYEEIGRSTFNGPQQRIESAIAHGKKVGADTVLISSSYSHTDQAVATIPHYTPGQTATVNSTTNINANAYGPRGYASGTATGHTTTQVTTPGTMSYDHVPVSVAKFDQAAYFFRHTGHRELPNTSSAIPLAKKSDTKGFYFSPYPEAYGADRNGIFDGSGMASGTTVRCPYTGKKVRIP